MGSVLPKRTKRTSRVVKHTLADGTTKVYTYPAYRPRPAQTRADSIAALIRAYQASPEWSALSSSS